ncbi:MAG: hypothetical protein AB8U44_00245 [Aaplasma endosymbiont of Hyalomma asiaticum]
MDLVYGSSPKFMAGMLSGFFIVCLLWSRVSRVFSTNTPLGWDIGSPFVGVSIFMMRCFVVLLLLFCILQAAALACFVSFLSKYKSFAAVVEWFSKVNTERDNKETCHQNGPKREEDLRNKPGEKLRKCLAGSALWLREVSSFYFSTERFPIGRFCPRN